jgi:uncharacterized protein (DUF433 family)
MATISFSLDSLFESDPDYRQGRPCLKGTGITVHSVAAAHLRGASVQDMCGSNPDLDPSLFHAALAYYFANRKQVEADLESDRVEAEQWAVEYRDRDGKPTARLT